MISISLLLLKDEVEDFWETQREVGLLIPSLFITFSIAMFMKHQTDRRLCMMNLKRQSRAHFSSQISAGSINMKLILCML